MTDTLTISTDHDRWITDCDEVEQLRVWSILRDGLDIGVTVRQIGLDIAEIVDEATEDWAYLPDDDFLSQAVAVVRADRLGAFLHDQPRSALVAAHDARAALAAEVRQLDDTIARMEATTNVDGTYVVVTMPNRPTFDGTAMADLPANGDRHQAVWYALDSVGAPLGDGHMTYLYVEIDDPTAETGTWQIRFIDDQRLMMEGTWRMGNLIP